MSWRTVKPCDNCPFRRDAHAIQLRFGRLRQIASAALIGGKFWCHKTVYTPRARKRRRRTYLECAGVVEWRNRVLQRWPTLAGHALRQLLHSVTQSR